MLDVNRKKNPARNGLVARNDSRRVDTGSEASLAGRVQRLPRDVGWMLFSAGCAGVVAPGIVGLPFMLAGGMILWPKTTRRLQRYLGGKPPEDASGMKQITRFLDDLERRYPKTGKP